jgi:MFS family permease
MVWSRLGARRAYTLGAGVFALGTVCCALAPDIGAIDRCARGARLGRGARREVQIPGICDIDGPATDHFGAERRAATLE